MHVETAISPNNCFLSPCILYCAIITRHDNTHTYNTITRVSSIMRDYFVIMAFCVLELLFRGLIFPATWHLNNWFS